MINEDLDIAAQGPWKLGIYSDLKSSRETVQASSLFCSWEVQSPISLQKHFLKYFEMWEYSDFRNVDSSPICCQLEEESSQRQRMHMWWIRGGC